MTQSAAPNAEGLRPEVTSTDELPADAAASLAEVSRQLASVTDLDVADRVPVFDHIHATLAEILATTVPASDAARTPDGNR